MKICYLAPASSVHTVRWVNALANYGYEVHLVSMHDFGINRYNKQVSIYNLSINPPLGYYINYLAAKKIISSIQPDIIHTHYASGYGTLSRFLNYYPTLLSVWGSDVYEFPYKNVLNKKIIEKNLHAADYISSTSNAMKSQIEKLTDNAVLIEVIPFGINLEKFYSYNETKENDIITIGTVKSLEHKYGIEYLIKAIRVLIDKLKDEKRHRIAKNIRLLIIGGGSEKQKYKNMVIDYGLKNISKITGAVPHKEVPKYLNMLDIYCAPSRQESFGVAVVEASACELPVVVSDVGGLPEVVDDRKTGLVFPSGNYKKLATLLYELVINKTVRDVYGKNGRKKVVEMYNWEKNVQQMIALYEKIIQSRR